MLETAASVGWKVKDAIVWFHGIGRLATFWRIGHRSADLIYNIRGACAGARLIALAVPSRLRSGGARSAASAPYRGVLASAIVVCPAAMRAQLLVAESAIVRGDVEARPQA
jgi:hypothetical protein